MRRTFSAPYMQGRGQIHHYASPEAVVAMEAVNRNNAFLADSYKENMQDVHNCKENWYECPVGKSVAQVMEEGHEGLVQALQDAERHLTQSPRLTATKRKRSRAMTGGLRLDPVRVLSGSLRPWDKMIRIDAPSKIGRHGMVTIIAAAGVSGGENGETLKWTGAVALVLAKRLMASRRKVRILYSDPSNSSFTTQRGVHRNYTICLKDYGEPTDETTLATSLMWAGFYRTVGFQAICKLEETGTVSSGLGSPRRCPAVEEYLPVTGNDTVLVVDFVRSQADAERKLSDLIAYLEEV